MKFNKLSKEKKQHLIVTIVIILAVLAGLGNYLILGGNRHLDTLKQNQVAALGKLEEMQKTIKRREQVETAFKETSDRLTVLESGMATGDLYSWVQSFLRKFQRNYRIDIPQINPISQPGSVDLLPGFPYQQASLSVAGTAYYHDLGQFIADFENEHPLMRIANLSLNLSPAASAAERDKLAFRMDIITLVKPTTAPGKI
ncbi:MAG TPA: hypothetical protein PKN95_00035 [Verrucomicrobiota bacterium]|nr:hypothetical protein [Verrucomicrobiota bacterium]HNT13473.1 hypothetical protein [Verrucomicrobiota bacterium]